MKINTKEELLIAHHDYRDIWENGIENYPFARRRILPIINEIYDGSRVLDVGCNSGEFIKWLKDKKKYDVYGVDYSQKVVDICHSKGLTNVSQCDADKLPFPDDFFDVVTLMEVLEHLADPVNYLKEIRRVLKKDGYFLGTCPHANLEHYMWDDERLHNTYYTEEGLKKDLYAAFDVVHLQILTGGQFNPAWANSFLAKEPAEMLFKCGGKNTLGWDEMRYTVKKNRIFWAPTQLSGDCYYRMWGYADKITKYEFESAYERWGYNCNESQTKWVNNLNNGIVLDGLESLMKIADLSIFQLIQSRMGVPFLMSAKEVIKKPIVTEVDDWLFDIPSYNVASNPYKPNSDSEWMAYKQLELSDAIICSTKFIEEGLRLFFPDKKIYVVPNGIDFGIYDEIKVNKEKYPKTRKNKNRLYRLRESQWRS